VGGGELIRGEALISFFSISIWWPDMIIFLNTSSAPKQQHKLFIDIESWSLSLNRGTVSTKRVHLTCSQTETLHKSNTTRQKLYILCCLSARPQNVRMGKGPLFYISAEWRVFPYRNGTDH